MNTNWLYWRESRMQRLHNIQERICVGLTWMLAGILDLKTSQVVWGVKILLNRE